MNYMVNTGLYYLIKIKRLKILRNMNNYFSKYNIKIKFISIQLIIIPFFVVLVLLKT